MHAEYQNIDQPTTPVTITMDHHTFYEWLREIADKRSADADGHVRPNLYFAEDALPSSRFEKVEAFLHTAEGTIIARHHTDDDLVTVTIRVQKQGPHLMTTLRRMLGGAA